MSADAQQPAPLYAFVEIPKGSRNKYEYDPVLGGIKFDRLLMSAATYPTDYGYLRGTLGQDGDLLRPPRGVHEGDALGGREVLDGRRSPAA